MVYNGCGRLTVAARFIARPTQPEWRRKAMTKTRTAALLLSILCLVAACGGNPVPTPPPPPNATAAPQNDAKVFSIIAGSEQKSILDTIVVPWCQQQHY